MQTNLLLRPPILRRLLAAALLAALLPVSGLHAAAAPLKLADYKATYERELARIRTNDTTVLTADASYLKALTALQAEFRQQGDFENTTAVLAERKRFEACKLVPDAPPENLPPAIAKAQAGYRAVLAQGEAERNQRTVKLLRSYASALKGYVKALLDQDKMDEAKEANTEMKRAEAELAKLETPAPAVEPAAPDAGTAPPGTTPAATTAAAGTKLLPPELLRGLVLYYSFDKDEGNTVPDKSPERNAGTAHGARWTAQGKVGGAYEFNGKSDYISVKPRNHMPALGDFSVSLWTYAQPRQLQVTGSGHAVDRQYIFDAQADATSGQYRGGLFLVYDFNGSGNGEIHNGMLYDPVKGESTEQNTRADVGEGWHHMVFVRQGRDDTTYLDGKPLDSTYSSQVKRNATLDLNHAWSIGTFAGNNNPGSRQYNYSFKGKIDEVMVFKRAITDDEVKQICNLQK